MIELIFMFLMLALGAGMVRVIVLERARYRRIVAATAKKHAKEIEAQNEWLANVRQIQGRGVK